MSNSEVSDKSEKDSTEQLSWEQRKERLLNQLEGGAVFTGTVVQRQVAEIEQARHNELEIEKEPD